MTINGLNKQQKTVILLLGLLFITIFVLLFFLQPSNKYGNEIGVNNYDKYISNLPTDRKDSINSTLYNITKNNLKSGNPNINDATIRDKSVDYNYDKTTNVHSGSFIVDMPSIKQSYLISYEWSSDSNNGNLSGYTAAATCLPSDKLIYGDFGCKDDFTPKNNTNRDPILGYLPYSTFNYSITANNDSGKISLNVSIFLYLSDTRDGGKDASISKYKSQVINWIKSKKLNPADYTIYYSIH